MRNINQLKETKSQLRLLLMAVVMICLQAATVDAKPLAEAENVELTNSITNMIEFPGDLKSEISESEQIHLRFVVDENDLISVIASDGTNSNLSKYVKEQLNGKSIDNTDVIKGKNYIVNINFKLL